MKKRICINCGRPLKAHPVRHCYYFQGLVEGQEIPELREKKEK